jgi:hypothetical protein
MNEEFDPKAFLAELDTFPLQAEEQPSIDRGEIQHFDPKEFLHELNIEHYNQQQAQFGSIEQQAKATVEGALRGATLGASDVALVKFGLTTPEKLKGRKEANPTSEWAAKMIGGTAALGGIGKFFTGPIEAAAIQTGTPQALATMGKWGTEGALLSMGDMISDSALGDPKLSGDQIIAELGLGFGSGAMLAGLGKAIQAAPALFRRAQLDEAMIRGMPKGTADATMGQMLPDMGGKAAAYLEKGMLPENLKKNAKEIIAAAKIGSDYVGKPIGTFEGILSARPDIQQADYTLTKLPSSRGVQRNQAYRESFWNMSDAVKKTLGESDNHSRASLGRELQERFTHKFEERYKPIAQKFSEIMELLPEIYLTKEERSTIENALIGLRKVEGLPPGERRYEFVTNFAHGIRNIETLHEFVNWRNHINDTIKADRLNLRNIGGKMMNIVEDMEDEIIKSSAERLASTFKGTTLEGTLLETDVQRRAKEVLKLIPKFREARKDYAQLIRAMQKVSEFALGDREVGGPEHFFELLNDKTYEQFSKAIFQKHDSQAIKWMKDFFPEELKLLSQFEKDEIVNLASKDNRTFNGKTALKHIFDRKKVPEELRDILFTPDEQVVQSAADLYFTEFLQNFNPSGTATQHLYNSFLEALKHPKAAAGAYLQGRGLEQFVKSVGLSEEHTGELRFQAEKAAGLESLSNIIKKTQNRMNSGIKEIFNTKIPNTAKGITLRASINPSEKTYDEHMKEVKELVTNPQKLMDHLDKTTEGLSIVAPNITQSINTTAVQSLQFLSERIPQTKQSSYLSESLPTKAQMLQFEKNYQTATDPLTALDRVKDGTLDNETMLALETIYPALLNDMRVNILGQMTEEKAYNLPYAIKITLSKFLNSPLEDNMMPGAILLNQQSFQAPQQSTQAMPREGRKAGMGGMKKLNFSGHSATRTVRSDKD